jgi:hypothetical protein
MMTGHWHFVTQQQLPVMIFAIAMLSIITALARTRCCIRMIIISGTTLADRLQMNVLSSATLGPIQTVKVYFCSVS